MVQNPDLVAVISCLEDFANAVLVQRNASKKQIGKAFKRNGLAVSSKTFGGGNFKKRSPSHEQMYFIYESGMIFSSLKILCDHIGADERKVLKRLTRGDHGIWAEQNCPNDEDGFAICHVFKYPEGLTWQI